MKTLFLTCHHMKKLVDIGIIHIYALSNLKAKDGMLVESQKNNWKNYCEMVLC